MRHVRASALAALVLAAGLSACRQDMHDQPRYEPQESSRFFEDGRSARPVVEGTVARGDLRDDDHLWLGKVDDAWVEEDVVALERGRERYDIFCAPCHDRAGTGRGMIVERGYRRPPSLHDERLRATAPGYFYDVIVNGFGVMPAYAAQIPVRDRWAIVAYLRALQLSQHASKADVPPSELAKIP
jgi:mono/diheme cytochrome c family protein